MEDAKQFLALNHVIVFCATVVLLLITAIAYAEPIDIGTFDKIDYTYETSTVEKLENSVRVWVVSTDQSFNVTHDKHYVGVAVHLEIDCSGHTAGLLEEDTFDKYGHVLVQGKTKTAIQLFPITIGKMTHELFNLVCRQI